jgi:hypothetical protein
MIQSCHAIIKKLPHWCRDCTLHMFRLGAIVKTSLRNAAAPSLQPLPRSSDGRLATTAFGKLISEDTEKRGKVIGAANIRPE